MTIEQYTCIRCNETFWEYDKSGLILCPKCDQDINHTQRAKEKVIQFLKANGWELSEHTKEYESYNKYENIGVDISHDDITLIDDQGDFASHPLTGESLYWLIGRLIAARALSMGFKIP